MRICAIHQPQFMPWLGYLDKIRRADVFVFLDNVQFKKNEFQNRNRILVQGVSQWLTVPVRFAFGDTLREVRLPEDTRWKKKMWQTVSQHYTKAPFFKEYAEGFRDFLFRDWPDLAACNQASVEWLMACFGIDTERVTCSELPSFTEERTGRLVEICRHLNADTYLSGAGAREYLALRAFEEAGVRVIFQAFRHPVYPQLSPIKNAPFVPFLSALDALFNCGGGFLNLYSTNPS
ncbi:MAG: hypothetical protein EOM20_00145 [Spartobacteria bacterium]|nr:hypothetical protein [Spartobacteria bacterium]